MDNGTNDQANKEPPQTPFDYLGLLAGLAAGELANILQGQISYYSGISREILSWTSLVIYIALIVNLISNRASANNTEKLKEN